MTATMTAAPAANGKPKTKHDTQANGFPVAHGELLGEIVCWDAFSLKIGYQHLKDALTNAGLDAAVAREMLPRHAFSRACTKLKDQRIIRQVDEDDSVIRFQFTAEAREAGGFRYDKEATLTLTKEDGTIACDSDELAAAARAELSNAMDVRTASDVTRIVQRLFEDKRQIGRDLIPLKRGGGFYFVRKEQAAFVDQIQAFVRGVGADMNRFPIAAGTPEGNASVKEAVAAKMDSLIGDFAKTVDEFDPSAGTKDHVLQAYVDRVTLLKHKVESYASYLEDEKARLVDSIKAQTDALTAKIRAMAQAAASE